MTSHSPTHASATLATGAALLDAFNQRDIGIWERATADDLVADYPGASGMTKQAALAYDLMFFNAVPDGRFTIEHAIADGNVAIFTTTVRGTFSEPLATPKGVVPPTGRRFSVPFVLIAELRDGRIVR